MALRRKVLVIEYLGVTAWLYALLMRWRFAQAYYVWDAWLLRRYRLSKVMARLAGLTRLRFQDFVGSYYDVQGEAAQHATDAFHAAHGRANPLRSLLLAYRDHVLLDVALRKALLLYYTWGRVRTWVFLKELRKRHDQIVFVPRDNLPFGRYVSPPWQGASSGCRVPSTARLLNGIREGLARMLVAPAVFLVAGELLWRRGLRRTGQGPESWPVAFDIFNGLAWHMPRTDKILYDGKDLTPQRILHVVRDRLTDEATRRHFETNGYPYVEFGRVPIPAGLFVRRMLGRALGAALRRAPHCLVGPSAAQSYLVPMLAVLRTTMEHEAFFSRYRIGVFVARDEYSVDSVVRTALIHDHGGRTVGFTHGDDTHPAPSNHYIAMDYICYPGAFQRDMLHQGNFGTPVLIGAGVYGLDDTFRFMQARQHPPKYTDIVGKHRTIGAFPTSVADDFCITREHLLNFYRTLLAIEAMDPNVYIIVCPKNQETGTADTGIREILARSQGRISIEDKISSYEIIPLCDLMICMASSTLGLEGLMARRRVLYFEEVGFSDHPYRRYDERLVARTPEELFRNVRWVLDEGGYLDPDLLERIRSDHGRCFDGKVKERLRAVVRQALMETPLAETNGDRA